MKSNLQKNQELEVWNMVSANRQRQRNNRSQYNQQYRSRRLQNGQQSYGKQRTQGRGQRDSARTYNRRQQSNTGRTQSRRQQYNSGGTQRSRRQYASANTYQQRGSQTYRSTQNPRTAAYKKKAAQAAKRKKAQKRLAFFFRSISVFLIIACLVGAFLLPGMIFEWIRKSKIPENNEQKVETALVKETEEILPVKIVAPMIKVDFIEVNKYSRPGIELNEIKSIFVHYTANPKTSAEQNRSYFSNLAETHERYASAHFIIGYTGEIIQCIPMDEQAYAVAGRNEDSVSIECCYIQKDGQFTQETYDSLIKLLAWLMQEYDLKSKDILRHYDCGGKRCPLYYVEHEDAWTRLLKDVDAYVESFETPDSDKIHIDK